MSETSKWLLTKLASRKFVLTATAMVSAILVAAVPEYKSELTAMIGRISAVLLATGALIAYLKVEGALDVARQDAEASAPQADEKDK